MSALERANFALVIILLGITAFARYIAPYDPLSVDIPNRLSPPSRQHLLGTDHVGRDLLSRILYGAQVSIPLAVVAPFAAAILGILIGSLAGYYGGILDEVAMRLCDLLLSIPELVLALAVVAALGPNSTNATIAIILTWIPVYARLVRGEARAVRELPFVESARSISASSMRIVFRHILPNCFSTVVVKGTLDIGRALRVLATLSFFGLGAQPPSPEWGRLVAEGRTFLSFWWLPILPGLAVLLVSICIAVLGDSVNDALNRGKEG
jgi:peptide/nickel transport system permease protein